MKRLCKMLVTYTCMLFCGFTSPISTYAYETNVQIEPRMANISTYSTELTISSGVALVTGFVRGKLGVTNTYVKVTLQKKFLANGLMWNRGKIPVTQEVPPLRKLTRFPEAHTGLACLVVRMEKPRLQHR